MKNTKPQRNIARTEELVLPTSPLMDGSWCVVDDSGSEGAKTPPPEKWEDCEDEIQSMLAPEGISVPSPPKEVADGQATATAAVPIPPEGHQARQFQAHLRNPLNTTNMAQSVEIPREGPHPSTELAAPLSRSLVTSEAEAMRGTNSAPGPVAKAAVRVAEWGRESQGVAPAEDSRTQEKPPTPVTSQPTTPSLRPTVVTGRFWGDEKPISPSLQSATPRTPAPDLSISDPALKSSGPEPRTVHIVKPEPSRSPDDDFEEMIWTMGKYVLLLGGALYLGNKARKRWTSTRG